MGECFRGVCVFNINKAPCHTNGEITSSLNWSVRDVFSHSKTQCFKPAFWASSIFFSRQKPDIAVRLSAALRFLVFMHNDSLGP